MSVQLVSTLSSNRTPGTLYNMKLCIGKNSWSTTNDDDAVYYADKTVNAISEIATMQTELHNAISEIVLHIDCHLCINLCKKPVHNNFLLARSNTVD